MADLRESNGGYSMKWMRTALLIGAFCLGAAFILAGCEHAGKSHDEADAGVYLRIDSFGGSGWDGASEFECDIVVTDEETTPPTDTFFPDEFYARIANRSNGG